MDCVVSGRGAKTVLLVLTERYSRKALIYKMSGKTQENVGYVLIKTIENRINNYPRRILKYKTSIEVYEGI